MRIFYVILLNWNQLQHRQHPLEFEVSHRSHNHLQNYYHDVHATIHHHQNLIFHHLIFHHHQNLIFHHQIFHHHQNF